MPVEYTSADSATLPSDDTDLSHVLDAGELAAISTDDDSTYAAVTNTAGYAVFQFENDATGKTAVTVTWDGKSDIAPSSSTVYLQAYDRSGTPAWVTIDSENGVGAGTDFTLTATLNAGSTPTLDNCKDVNGIIACRVYQATSVGPVLIASYSESNYNWANTMYTGGTPASGQCFNLNNVAGNLNLSSCKFFLSRSGDIPPGSVYAKLYDLKAGTTFGTNGVPENQSALATSDAVDPSTIDSGTYNLITFTFSTPYTLVKGNNYCISCEYNAGDGTHFVSFGGDNGTPSGAGNFYRGAAPATYTAYDTVDSCFYVYGT